MGNAIPASASLRPFAFLEIAWWSGGVSFDPVGPDLDSSAKTGRTHGSSEELIERRSEQQQERIPQDHDHPELPRERAPRDRSAGSATDDPWPYATGSAYTA
jgi:hypothetical protein